MNEQSIQSIAVQKVLQLSEEEALKVLIFMTGLEAGAKLNSTTGSTKKAMNRLPNAGVHTCRG